MVVVPFELFEFFFKKAGCIIWVIIILIIIASVGGNMKKDDIYNLDFHEGRIQEKLEEYSIRDGKVSFEFVPAEYDPEVTMVLVSISSKKFTELSNLQKKNLMEDLNGRISLFRNEFNSYSTRYELYTMTSKGNVYVYNRDYINDEFIGTLYVVPEVDFVPRSSSGFIPVR